MRVSGTWPGMITLRKGFGRAVARPWNEDSPGASLRLERGSSDFLREGAEHLLQIGAEWVGSPPVDPSSGEAWERAGFSAFLTLDLYSRDLRDNVAPPTGTVVNGAAADLGEAARIDSRSFEPVWRLGSLGLAEARAATPRSSFLVTRADARIIGFAIVGIAGTVGYLQRIAVDPGARGLGHGRSLLLASLDWCRNRGARQQLLNTQPGNAAAAGLYLSEGYRVHEGALSVLRFDG